MRGYCGIGVLNIKTEINYGTLFRSANCFGADFIFLVGRRFKKMSADTMQTQRHLPLYEYENVDDFLGHIPYDCQLIGVEVHISAIDLKNMSHPERAIYILGPEDNSLPPKLLSKCVHVVKINTTHCLNVAVAGSIVLFDRFNKMKGND